MRQTSGSLHSRAFGSENLDLEGYGPLQPREQNIVPIGFGGAEGPAPSTGLR